MIKVANINISADNCGPYVITLTGVDATYFKVINKELYLLLDTPEPCKLSYTVDVNIKDLTGRFIKTKTYNLNTADCVCVALKPTFGIPTSTATGFTVQITNYDPNYSWVGTASASGSVAISNSGLVTVIGVAALTNSTATINTTRVGYISSSATVSALSLGSALLPRFGAITSTEYGFTFQIVNYNTNYVWVGTPTISGSVTISAVGLVTVTGVATKTSSTVTITATRLGYVSASTEVTATSLDVGLTPTFGSPTATADGFTVQITNYNALYTWAGTATAFGRLVVSGTGLVTVRGVAAGTNSTATITTTRIGYAIGSEIVTATSIGYTALFYSTTRTANGFTVQIANYDPNYTWVGTATEFGVVAISGTGLVTVTGVAPATSSTVTIITTRVGYIGGSATATAISLNAALTPLFGTPIATADGFTVQITNYDSSYSWGGSSYGASVSISGSGLVTVAGLVGGTAATVTIDTIRIGHVGGYASVTMNVLATALTPLFGATTSTYDGFTVQITNYNASYTWAGTATAGGSVVVSGTGLVTVTGIAVGGNSTAAITTVRTGYSNGLATVAAPSLGYTPTFGVPTRTATGFTVQISNYNASFTWAGTATASGVVVVSGSGLVTVSGVASATSSTAAITTTRIGYASGSAPITAISLGAMYIPTFGPTTRTVDGFTVQISNWNTLYAWASSATPSGIVTISGGGLITVTNVAAGTSSTVIITTTRDGHVNGSAQVLATSLTAALIPTFIITKTVDGFTIQITNYNASYSFRASATRGSLVMSTSGLLTFTVTGLAIGAFSEVTITTDRTGYADGLVRVNSASLSSALTPLFDYPPTRTANGFIVQIINYDARYTWTITSINEGSAAIDDQGLLIVTGVFYGATSRVTIQTTRDGHTNGVATVSGMALYLGISPNLTPHISTVDGFTTQISNPHIGTYYGTVTPSGTLQISDSGVVTITGMAANTSSQITITSAMVGYLNASSTLVGTSLMVARTPIFGNITRTVTGFTFQISNFLGSYRWSGTATASGVVAINGSTGLVTVTGLMAGTTSTVTIKSTRENTADGLETVTATSLNTALTPTFGATTPTVNGFTVQISNYNASYDWAGAATASGVVAINGTGLVTVTGVAAGTSSTATITTMRNGHVTGSASVSGLSLGAVPTPTFGTITRTANGFIVFINNYDSAFIWTATATAGGLVDISGSGKITVTNLDPLTTSTVTITKTRIGYVSTLASVTANSLAAALTPTFGAATRTADGFTVQIMNYSYGYTWLALSSDWVEINSIGLVTVKYIAANTRSVVTITTTRSGHVDGSNSIAAYSLAAAYIPLFWVATPSGTGFTVPITNYNPNYVWAGTATNGGLVAINAINGSGLVTVTGLPPWTSSTATITTTASGYVRGSASVTMTSLFAPLTPSFGPTTTWANGFTSQITNYNASFTWAGTATASGTVVVPVVTIGSNGLVTVTNVPPLTLSRATITTRRVGYVSSSGTVVAVTRVF